MRRWWQDEDVKHTWVEYVDLDIAPDYIPDENHSRGCAICWAQLRVFMVSGDHVILCRQIIANYFRRMYHHHHHVATIKIVIFVSFRPEALYRKEPKFNWVDSPGSIACEPFFGRHVHSRFEYNDENVGSDNISVCVCRSMRRRGLANVEFLQCLFIICS